MVYPNGRILHYSYSSGLDSAISRVSYLADDNGSGGDGTHLEEYSYLGLAQIVKQVRTEAGIDLSYVKLSGESNGDGGDQYTGLDRFGRVADRLANLVAQSMAAERQSRFRKCHVGGFDRLITFSW